MKRILLLCFAFLFVLGTSWAQRTVSGTVTSSADGSTVPGVNVVLKGTTTGTTTDLDGNYRLSVPEEGGTLVFSFIGLATKEVEIGARSVVDVVMEEDVETLSEVVVTGYGTQLKTETTGSITRVAADDIEKLNIVAPDQALQGLAAGVFVSSSNGAPGSGLNIRVRGQTSINSGNQPLYVIDGVVVQAGGLTQTGVGGGEQNALNNINPQDIESIEVLKDAASTAIYGARGANGVVLITTKRGKEGKPKIDVRAWTGWGEPTNLIDKASAALQVEIEREAFINDNPGATPPTNAEIGWDGETEVDWIDEVFRTARQSEYQVALSGGSEKFKYYTSANFRDEEGTMIGFDFERYSIRNNLDYNASDVFSMGTSISLSRSVQNLQGNDNNIYGIYGAAVLTPAWRRMRDPETGEFVDALPSFNTNPVRMAEERRNRVTNNRLIANVFTELKLFEGLTFRTDFSYDYVQLREDIYAPVTTAQGRGSNGTGSFGTRERGTWLIEPTLRYSNTLGAAHKINAVLGLTAQEQEDFNSYQTGQGFARPTLTYLTSAATPAGVNSNTFIYSFASIFGRVNYAYQNKYLASVTVRRDGSSRFGPNQKFGLFYAVSGGWNFSEEDFFNVPFIEFGKIRASYGVTGNDQIGNFTYIGAFTGGANYLDQPASSPSQIENADLKWEETTSIDIGLELSFFGGRVDLNTGVFQMNTVDQLFPRQIPWTTGFGSVQSNIGEVQNRGLEIELNSIIVDTEFKWNLNANISFIENEIVELEADEPIQSGFASAIIEGEPLNTFWALDWLGVDPATGRSVFRDVDGDGVVGGNDLTIIGDHQPDFLGGLQNSFSYKGFTLDAFFQFVWGVDVYNNTLPFGLNPSAPWGQFQAIERRWQQPGDVTDVPRASTQTSLDFSNDSDRWLSDGSYVRLRNVTLAYQLPANVVSAIKLRSARVFVQGQNLLTFTRYNGNDPEVSTFGFTNSALGTDFLTFPQNKVYSVGVNIGL